MLMQRRALNAVALALGVVCAPSLVEAQSNRNLPGADTPRLLVVVFHSPNRALGVEVADAIRQRMTTQMVARVLYIIPREQMVNFLESSGYKADSSLGATDLKELAKGLRADDLLGGEVTKNGTALRFVPRLMLASDPSIGQPLPAFETTSLSDASRQIERSYQDARKQLADERACKNHIRDGAIDKAIVTAKAGIVKYPNAVIARLCLANAFQYNKMWDSVLAVTDAIRKLDQQSKLANMFAFTAYKEKADAEPDAAKALPFREASVNLLVALIAIDPFNQSLQNNVISELAKLGKPAMAIPIVDQLLKQNPGDPPMLRTRWQLIGADAAAADSATKIAKIERYIAAGEDMAKSDTTLADSTYYFRQVAASMIASPQKGIEWTSRAVAKYPTNQDYWWYKARLEQRGGQIPAASQSLSRLLVLNAKYPNATVMLGQLYLDQKMNDSAIAVARRAVANGEPKTTWGQFLLAPTQAAYQRAAASDSIARADTLNAAKRTQATADYEATLALAQEADKMNPTPQAYFFSGVASFQIGYAAVNAAQASGAASAPATKGTPSRAQRNAQAAARAKACELAKRATDMFLLTMTNMPKGGSVSPATAQQLLGFTPQLSTAADQMTKAYCGPPAR